MLRSAAVAISILLSAPGAAWAHHGWGLYDTAAATTVDGAVQAVRWRNPHVEMDVKAGAKVWTVVLGPVPRVAARGLSAKDLPVGARVKVAGYPRKDGVPEVRAERITVGAKTVEMR